MLQVADQGGRERTIRYKPAGRTNVTFQRLTMPGDFVGDQAQRCARTLAGG